MAAPNTDPTTDATIFPVLTGSDMGIELIGDDDIEVDGSVVAVVVVGVVVDVVEGGSTVKETCLNF